MEVDGVRLVGGDGGVKVESRNQKREGQVTEGWGPRKGGLGSGEGRGEAGPSSSTEVVGLGSAQQDSS